MGKAHQLAGITVDVRTRVDYENGLARAGKQRADGCALDAGMESEQQRACGHHGAGVAGRNERVALALFLKTQTHGDRRSRLAADRREGLVPHADDFGRLDDLNPAAVDGGNPPQRRLDVRRPPDELHLEVRRNLPERLCRPLHLDLRGVVTTHRIQCDADHQSSTVTRCTPL